MKFGFKKQPPPPGRRRAQVSEQSPAAFSYYAQRSDDRQNAGRTPGRNLSVTRSAVWQNIAERGGLFLLLLAIVAGTINSLSLSTTPRIVPLGSGSTVFLHDQAAYATTAQTILSGSIWNRNKITINTKAVAGQLKARFPELADVSITLPLIAHHPVVYIQPSPPVLILQTNKGGYVIGQNGTALLPTTQLPSSSTLDLPVVNDQTGVTVQTGKRALPSGDVAFIQMVTGQLKAAGMGLGELTLPPASSELDVRLKDKPYFIKFNTHASLADARQQAGTLIAVSHKLESQHVTPGEYIDVRVTGRAYYK